MYEHFVTFWPRLQGGRERAADNADLVLQRSGQVGHLRRELRNQPFVSRQTSIDVNLTAPSRLRGEK
jgi:hypothetical protein